jgi:hypothetical protein
MEQLPKASTYRWKWPLAAVVVIVAAWWGYRWLYPSYQPRVQPVPNGYTELVALSNKLTRRTRWYNQVSDQELGSIVTENEPFLEQAREALRTECVVALDWQADRQWFDNIHLKNIAQMKELSRAFAAEGLLDIKQGKSRLAINSGLENLHLAKAASNGGLGTDWLSGIATYTIGLMTLRDACEIAAAKDCKFLLNNLPDVREQLEPPAEITAREWHFFRRINGAWATYLTEMTFSNNRVDFENRMEDSRLTAHARAELLRLHYAIRAFQLREDRLPRALTEVIGPDLTEIPADPCGGRDFIYQVASDNYLLYSVGPNGVDDGGTESPRDPNQGDVLLEPSGPRG